MFQPHGVDQSHHHLGDPHEVSLNGKIYHSGKIFLTFKATRDVLELEEDDISEGKKYQVEMVVI